MSEKVVNIFCCYSHDDKELKEELKNHLSVLVTRGMIKSWDDSNILASIDWLDDINNNLYSADIVLLLVSSSFMNSDFINNHELRIASERRLKGEVKIIPIILRECFWEIAEFANLQALPTNSIPVMSWSSKDAAFTDVTKGIYRLIKSM